MSTFTRAEQNLSQTVEFLFADIGFTLLPMLASKSLCSRGWFRTCGGVSASAFQMLGL